MKYEMPTLIETKNLGECCSIMQKNGLGFYRD